MSCNKIFDNRFKPFSATAVTAGATITSKWLPIDGWVAKYLDVNCESAGSPDLLIAVRFSSQGYYELRALADAGTISTDNYEQFTVAANHSATTRTRYDEDDQAELSNPYASVQIVVTGNGGSAATTVDLVFGGLG